MTVLLPFVPLESAFVQFSALLLQFLFCFVVVMVVVVLLSHQLYSPTGWTC